MIDVEVLRTIAANGGTLTKKGRNWNCGPQVFSRADVGRLYHAKLLSGCRGANTLELSDLARMALRKDRCRIPLGSRVVFRNTGYEREPACRYLEGQVIAFHNGVLLADVGDKLYQLRRLGADDRWKGSKTQVGAFRHTPAWNLLRKYVPDSYFLPLTTQPNTVARMRELAARLAPLGYCYDLTDEETVAMMVNTNLAYFRYNARFVSGGRAACMQAIIDNDEETLLRAERAHVSAHVRELMFSVPYRTIEPVELPPLADIVARLHQWPADMVSNAYLEHKPDATVHVRLVNDRIKRLK